MTSTLGWVPFLVLGSGVAAAAEPPAAATRPGAESRVEADPLGALNDASRAAYRLAKEEALSRSGPLVLVEGDVAVLRRGERRVETRFTPGVFHALKSVSHIALALDVMLGSAGDIQRLGDERLGELRRYRDLIVGARGAIGNLDLTPEQARRQKAIIAGSLGFLDELIGSRTCGPEARAAYARRMAPLVMANADDAAAANLDALHRVVVRWKGEMPAGDWDRLTVIVMGRQLPRKDNLAVQYFARLLGEPGEGPRIVYAESLFEEPKALDLLATRLVDTQVGRDFFNDPARMHRDLLADAAREYLDRLLGPPGRAPR